MFPQQLSRKVRYESDWVSVYTDEVRLPSGKTLNAFHVIEYSSEAAAALIENEVGGLLLAQVYRYPTGRVEWEIPGGRIDAGETPVQTAVREAFEETGWELRDPRLLYSFHPTNGISNQQFHIVHGFAAKQNGTIDADEIHDIRWFSKEEIRDMIDRQAFKDGFTLTALLLWLR